MAKNAVVFSGQSATVSVQCILCGSNAHYLLRNLECKSGGLDSTETLQ